MFDSKIIICIKIGVDFFSESENLGGPSQQIPWYFYLWDSKSRKEGHRSPPDGCFFLKLMLKVSSVLELGDNEEKWTLMLIPMVPRQYNSKTNILPNLGHFPVKLIGLRGYQQESSFLFVIHQPQRRTIVIRDLFSSSVRPRTVAYFIGQWRPGTNWNRATKKLKKYPFGMQNSM
jgi:hypothetical protein